MFGGKEPAVVFGGLATLISLVIPVLILFEIINWSDKQIAGVMALVTFATGFAATLLTRQSSVPQLVADKQIEIAKASSINTPTEHIIQQAKESV